MNNRSFYIFILVLIAFSALLILARELIPDRKRDLLADGSKQFSVVHSGQINGGETIAVLKNTALPTMDCTLVESQELEYCGISRFFGPERSSSEQALPPKPVNIANLSGFGRLDMRLIVRRVSARKTDEAAGTLPAVRLVMRSFNDELFSSYELLEPVVSSYIIQQAEFSRPLSFRFEDFSTSEWWILENKVPTREAQLALNQVSQIMIELPPQTSAGSYEITIAKMTLVGEWLSLDDLLVVLFSSWMVALALLSILQIMRLRKAQTLAVEQIGALQDNNKVLQNKSDFFQKLSTYDSLTGILNRHGFGQERDSLFQQGAIQSYCLAVVDIDLFKRINDQYGHSVGDEVIAQTATIIRQSTRNTDLIARWGGEEYVVLFPTATIANAIRICEKIADRMREFPLASVADETITLSFGIASGSASERFDDVFQRADRQLYQAKNNGRDQICF